MREGCSILRSGRGGGFQETKLKSEETVEAAKIRARASLWNSCHTVAACTAADKASGGCAVCVRKGAGIETNSSLNFAESVDHRITHAWINGVTRGGIHIFSVYAKDIVGPTCDNLTIMEELQAAVRSVNGPWIIVADWNMTPSTPCRANARC